MGRHKIEIKFTKRSNPITLLIGKNGSGKTSILSNLHPFPYVESGDVRNTQDLILPNKEGRKELDIVDGDNVYKIDIRYLLQRDKRTTRCYISKNGRALNPTGLVRSYYDVLNTEFSIDPSLLRIIRLGPNVADLISMRATERKDFISGFLADVEIYDKLFSIAKDESIYLRNQLKVVTNNYDQIEHISTLEHERKKCNENIIQLGERINQCVSDLAVLTKEMQDTDMSSNDIDRAIENYHSIEEVLDMYNKVDDKNGMIKQYMGLSDKIAKFNTDLDQKYKDLASLKASMGDLERRLTEYKKKLEILQANSVDGNIDDAIKNYEDKLQAVNCKPTIAIPETYNLILRLWKDSIQVIESISDINVFAIYKKHMLYSTDENVMDDIKVGIDKQIEKIQKQITTIGFGVNVYNSLIGGTIVYIPGKCPDPNTCPYYNILKNVRDMSRKPSESTKPLTDMLEIYQTAKDRISSLRIVQKNISAINDFNTEIYIEFGEIFADIVSLRTDRLKKIDSDIQEVLSRARDYALADSYRIKLDELKQRKKDLDSVGAENIIRDEMRAIKDQQLAIHEKIINLFNLTVSMDKDIQEMNTELLLIEPAYNAVMEYTSNLEKYTSIQQQYEKAKVAESVLDDLRRKIQMISGQMETLKNAQDDENNKLIELIHKIKNKESLEKQLELIKDKYSYVELVREALSSTKGIPLVFIQLYLKNIQILANNIIRSMFSDDEIQLKDFVITDKEFSIPYTVNGIEVLDASYSSQGERATIVLALSFALLSQMMGRYNILLLDEIDSALYKDNRRRFIKIVEEQMKTIGCEQAFLITHNNLFENYPVDIILTSDLEDMVYNKGNIIWTPKEGDS